MLTGKGLLLSKMSGEQLSASPSRCLSTTPRLGPSNAKSRGKLENAKDEMSNKTELRQAQLISQQPSVPGSGTVTSVVLRRSPEAALVRSFPSGLLSTMPPIRVTSRVGVNNHSRFSGTMVGLPRVRLLSRS